jgi:hypothetical protein
MARLGLGLHKFSRRLLAGVPAINPLLVAANRGIQNNNVRVASTANLTCGETRMQMKTGRADLSELRFVYSNFYLLPNSGVETNAGNTFTLQVAVEWPGYGVRQVTFSGSADPVTVADGIAALVSDALLPSAFSVALTAFPKNTVFWLRSRRIVAQGARHVKHGASGSSGEITTYNNGTFPSQLLAEGAMIKRTDGADAQAELGPQAIIGRAVGTPDIAVCVIDDSIADGNNDNDIAGLGSAGGGFMVRGLWNVGGGSIPWIKQTCGGSTAQNMANGLTKRSVYWQWVTHVFCDYGTNDFVSGARTQAQVLADLRTIWNATKTASGSKVRRTEQMWLIPRVGSSNAYVDTAGQTPINGFAVGGDRRDALNVAMQANVGQNGLDAVLNPNTALADGALPDRWRVNGTANYATNDGVHPSPAAHVLAAPVMAARAATWV